jgi:23S rRNA (adenine1618-N6)-methyltransferase
MPSIQSEGPCRAAAFPIPAKISQLCSFMDEHQQKDAAEKASLHPRNLHRERYDFVALVASSPELGPYVRKRPTGEATIDFADPVAVKALNRALLIHHYGIQHWEIPTGYLCPPVPGRADYIHYVADLLATTHGGVLLTGKAVRVLDIGVGANCVFPIIGRHVYGWSFVGADIDPVSVKTAQQIVAFNPSLKGHVEIRWQPNKAHLFPTIWQAHEKFELTICNPPFHASQADADAKTARKLRNLGLQKGATAPRNFGGQNAELFVDGGELAFVKRMVRQSVEFARQCLWFTTVVSKAENLNPIYKTLEAVQAFEVKTIDTQQGQKTSRIVAWTFLHPKQRSAWHKRRAKQGAE